MNLSEVNRNDLAVLAGGALTFIFSLFPAYLSLSVDGGGLPGVDAGSNAWTSFASLGMLLILAATALVAIRVFAPQVLPKGVVPCNLITAGVAGLGALLLVLRALTASESAFGVSIGPGWSAWLVFITSIGMTVFAALAFVASGEKLPGSDSTAGDTPSS